MGVKETSLEVEWLMCVRECMMWISGSVSQEDEERVSERDG